MYQCPNCGGNIKFDIASQKMACANCNSYFDPYDISKETDAEENTYFDVTEFICPQCGGRILSTENTAANFCSYCGASTILSGRLTKEKRPGYIIPFKMTKQDCKEAYKKKVKNAIFAPKELKDPEFIDGFRGIYMPYWVYHVTQKGMSGFRFSRSHRKGDYIYTDNYELSGYNNSSYKGLSFDASSSFDDTLSQAIAPFDAKNMNTFTPSFLSGFYADTADVPKNTYEYDAKSIAEDASVDYIKNSVIPDSKEAHRYNLEDSDSQIASHLDSHIEKTDCAMFPVWFLSYRKKDRVAYATINGQTGKIAADLPVSIGKFITGSLLLTIPIFLFLNVFFTFLPTTTLTLVAFIALISMILYGIELKEIKKRDEGLDDIGKYAICNDNFDNKQPVKNKRKRSFKKVNNSKFFSMFTAFFIVFITFNIMSMTAALMSSLLLFNFGPIFWIAMIIIGIVLVHTHKKTLKTLKNKFVIPGSLPSLAAIIIAAVISILKPVSDLFYYGGCIGAMIAVVFSLISLINYYNMLATRKLPEFDNYNGGDDDAD